MTTTRHVFAYIITFTAGAVVHWYLFWPFPNDNYPMYAPKHRPASISDSAVWVGGQDGGAYIDCYYNRATKYDDCAVFNDFTGDREIETGFVLDGREEGVPPEKLKYYGWSGDRIFLRLPSENGHEPSLVPANGQKN